MTFGLLNLIFVSCRIAQLGHTSKHCSHILDDAMERSWAILPNIAGQRCVRSFDRVFELVSRGQGSFFKSNLLKVVMLLRISLLEVLLSCTRQEVCIEGLKQQSEFSLDFFPKVWIYYLLFVIASRGMPYQLGGRRQKLPFRPWKDMNF